MKINWGTGIVIAIGCFMSFILYFVIKISTETNVKHNLVTEQYYQQEIKFQQEINALKNAAALKEKMSIEKTSEGLKIVFPKKFVPKDIKGSVFLYRPSNKRLDVTIPISISSSVLKVPEKYLVGGRWNVTVSWQYKNKEYLFKKKVTL